MRKFVCTILAVPVPFTQRTHNSRHSVQQDRYDAWKEEAAWAIKAEAKGDVMETPCKIGTTVYHVRMSGDHTNFHKAAEDACVYAGIIHDDAPKFVRGNLGGDFFIDKDNPRIEITIESTDV